MNVNSIENELIILTKQTIDIFLKSDSPGDLLALYSFYYYTAKWQGTNQPKCTTSYAARGLKWSEAKVRKAKRDLMSLGLIEDIVSKGADGKITSHYIRLRYIIKQSTLANLHTDEMPQGGKYNTVEEQGTNAFSADSVNALSSCNKNALNNNPSTSCKDYNNNNNSACEEQPQKTTKEKKPTPERLIIPPTLEMVEAYCKERNNGIDPEAFIDYYAARGWYLNKKQRMVDWHAAVGTWERNAKERQTSRQNNVSTYKGEQLVTINGTQYIQRGMKYYLPNGSGVAVDPYAPDDLPY